MGSHRTQASVPRHQLPKAWLSALASGEGSPEVTRYLWDTERSRRLLLVSTLLGEIEQAGPGGPLPQVATVWEALAAAQRAVPAEVGRLLLDPGVGSGCAYALRRIRGGARSDHPLWQDLGTPYALALVAAAAAGLPWSTRLPVRDGTVMVVTRGLARVPAGLTVDHVEASTERGRIRLVAGGHELVLPGVDDDADVVPEGAGFGWWALRRVHVGAELPLTVRIDDLDPYRDLADPVPPARLDAAALARWSGLLADAWERLCRDHRASAATMVDGFVALVPLKPEPGWDTRSASNGEAFGSIMVSEPPDEVTLAVALVHEYQHILLGGLLHLIRLTEPDDDALLYAPWRDDPRPLAGLIQGIFAFYGIARFWRERSAAADGVDAALAQFEFAVARQQTRESLDIALAAGGLTPAGRQFLASLRESAVRWADDAIDPLIAELATLTTDSHRIGWRLRHFRPEPGDVTDLAGVWSAGRIPAGLRPARARLREHPDLRWDQRIPAVTRRRATSGSGEVATAPADGVAAGENALLSRDVPGAVAAFASWLAGEASGAAAPTDDEARAWVGLALSAADRGATDVLTRRPDLVRAVYAELRAAGRDATPVDVAAWLAPAVPA